MDMSIKHYIDQNRYICNRAVHPTPGKYTRDWGNVNCMNCLKQKDRYEFISKVISYSKNKLNKKRNNKIKLTYMSMACFAIYLIIFSLYYLIVYDNFIYFYLSTYIILIYVGIEMFLYSHKL